MTLLEVIGLLSLIGGTIYGTFQVTWTISHKDNKKE